MIYLAANFYVRTLASIMASMASMDAFLASEWQVLASIGGLPQDCLIVLSGTTKVLLASMASICCSHRLYTRIFQKRKTLLYRQSYIKHTCHTCQAAKITYKNGKVYIQCPKTRVDRGRTMTVLKNPKQEGTNLWDCVPQRGPCPMSCNQCYYNRRDENDKPLYYASWEPLVPTPQEVGDGIVRMNCGHDSNSQRDLVTKTAQQYKHVFYNTSIPRLNFPGPVVYTANPAEEAPAMSPHKLAPNSIKELMFLRLRVSASNLELIEQAIKVWTGEKVPVVLTFMAYYDIPPQSPDGDRPYIWKTRHINSYWCVTPRFMREVLLRMKRINDRLVTMCGTPESNYCRDCRNCESYYWQTIKRLKGC